MRKNDTRNYARNRATGQHRATRFMIGVFVAIPLLLITTYVAISMMPSRPSSEQVVAAEDGMVRISLADVGPRAKFFRFVTVNKKEVRFFVVQSPDGVYHVAADACEMCYREKHGYRQEGSDMVCNACGRHFPSRGLNDIRGSCNPGAVQSRIAGGSLAIAAAELEAKEYLF